MIAVIGLGYVGLVGSVCLAKMGHNVIGVDIDERKIELLQKGQLPIYETDLDKEFEEVRNKLEFTTDIREAVLKSEICFVCVGTPSRKDGKVDLSYVYSASQSIGKALKEKEDYTLIVFRSTIPPGTSKRLIIPILERESGKKYLKDFGYAFNPEFLREGSAIYDFFNPPKTVVGCESREISNKLFELYKPIPGPKIELPLVESEMVKYVDNVWHAIKVAFANEVGYFAKKFGADGRLVMEVFCKDTKLNISPVYLKPGFAFGGSCLPKDVKGFVSLAREQGIEIPIIGHIMDSNWSHIRKAKRIIKDVVPSPEVITIVGVSFKPGTDDVRESPAVYLARDLLDEGYNVKFYDPIVKLDNIKNYFGKGFLPITENDFFKSFEEAFDSTPYLVFTGSFTKVPEDPELYKDKFIFDLNGIFYDKENIKNFCKYYALCW